jgi:hypothetical protein
MNEKLYQIPQQHAGNHLVSTDNACLFRETILNLFVKKRVQGIIFLISLLNLSCLCNNSEIIDSEQTWAVEVGSWCGHASRRESRRWWRRTREVEAASEAWSVFWTQPACVRWVGEQQPNLASHSYNRPPKASGTTPKTLHL